MLDLAHLPPGTPALLLIMGGLGVTLPVTLSMMLGPAERNARRFAPRSVLTAPRPPAAPPLADGDVTRIDQAIERVYRLGLGDARILHADAQRKILRADGCACARGLACDRTREAIERAVSDALGRSPLVRELRCERGRCEFAISY